MNTKNIPFKSLCFVFLLVIFFSCTTEDISPILIEVSSTETNLLEDDGAITVTATLNGPAAEQLVIPLTIEGTATVGIDYTLSSSQIIISAGTNSGEITLTSIQDDEVEGIETINIIVGDTFLSTFDINISVTDDDVNTDTDNDGVFDAVDACPLVPGEISNNGCPFSVIINEVLYDPPTGLAGDANGDGTRDATDDEFIEFYNDSDNELDLTGYTVSDTSQVRHTFPTGSIVPARGILVLFGGGNPTGSFGGAVVQLASEGTLNISNAGDVMTLRGVTGNVVVAFDVNGLSGNPDESYTRYPDLTGDFVQHGAEVPESNGALFSPGTKVDGSSF
ncbi:Calx-beta domain-containing protein [Tenacibaculum adriaticum]|uniref:Calx-beta domain-containing protein n=1 Tax=Tenacibaculum adriaticum TaxID=413713 RepID=A0A5S5DN94_9FLAO|nr:lamin tail domain-containing protein [Tenacibaculum adriaticum]TYP97420.1 Calx-beta domain-containing protein [Tenacibaculum adriaticum]